MNGQSQFRRIYEIVAVAIELAVEDREGDLDQAFRGAGALRPLLARRLAL